MEFKNVVNLYSNCKMCDKSGCKGCLVPYSEEKVEDMLDKHGLTRNDTLFGSKYSSGKELIVNITWHSSIM